MPSFATITAALALTASVAAGPVERRNAFSVEQVHKKTFAKNGAAATVKTLRKYGKPVPENLLKAAENGPNDVIFSTQASSGSDPATPNDAYDSSYLCPVTIGTTNPTTVNLDFDTGSGDLWVFSSLQASSSRAGHDYYKVDSSKKISGATWAISYGDGSGASGTVYADKVVVGGVTATSQAVEAATSVSSEFSSDQNTDGLLGLSFSSLNTVRPTPQKTFFDSVKSSLASPLFAANLKYHAAGTYDFGYIDSTKYTGSITYTNVDTSQGWWQFSFSGYSVGTSAATTTTSINGIADTGTTLLYLPSSVVRAYYAKVPGATNSNTYGGYVFSCEATLPDFSLVLGGVKQRVPGQYINYAPVEDGSSTCFGGIQSSSGIGFNIFGDIFLKSKYVVFDGRATPRIGFADQVGL